MKGGGHRAAGQAVAGASREGHRDGLVGLGPWIANDLVVQIKGITTICRPGGKTLRIGPKLAGGGTAISIDGIVVTADMTNALTIGVSLSIAAVDGGGAVGGAEAHVEVEITLPRAAASDRNRALPGMTW